MGNVCKAFSQNAADIITCAIDIALGIRVRQVTARGSSTDAADIAFSVH